MPIAGGLGLIHGLKSTFPVSGGLVAWWVADHKNVNSPASGSRVNRWDDISGYNHYCEQTHDSLMPTIDTDNGVRGREFLLFSGSNMLYVPVAVSNFSKLSNSFGVTVILFLTFSNISVDQCAIMKGSSLVAFNYGIRKTNLNLFECFYNNASRMSTTTMTVAKIDPTPILFGAEFTTTDTTFILSSSVSSTLGQANVMNSTTQQLFIGAFHSSNEADPVGTANLTLKLQGNYYEIMIFNRVLDTREIRAVQRYGTLRYGYTM